MSDKKKILIRIGSLRHGGAEKVLVTFLNNIPKDKYEIDLLLNLKFGKYLQEVPSWVNIIWLNTGEMIPTNRPWEIPVKIYRKLYQKMFKIYPKLLYKFILKNKKYEVELIANHALLEEMLESPLADSKKIVWVHNDIFSIPEYTEERIKNFFKADKVMVISEKIKEGFEAYAETLEQKQKLIKIYNPIDSKEFINKSEEKAEYTFTKEIPTFTAVGTIFPQKGFDRLLNVHQKLIQEGFPHKIIIVGDGYDMKNIEKQIERLGISNSVFLAGFQKNPYPFFKNSDYFILSSRFEGYPTVLYEALTLEKPIIATDVSGVKEILQEGSLGLIVENSEEGIYEGMKTFLSDPEIPKKYVDKMKEKELPFTLENAVNSLMKIIDNI